MTDINMLRDKIQESGLKMTYIANKLGISYPSFLARMKGEIEFRVDEVRTLKELLDLTDDEVNKIFY